MTLNELIDEKKSIKDQLTDLNVEISKLKEREDTIDTKIIEKLDSEGLARSANEVASVSIREDFVPDVQDWDALYEHIRDTEDFSLLHRRVSSTAFKERINQGDTVPGLQTREIRRVNFRTL